MISKGLLQIPKGPGKVPRHVISDRYSSTK